MRNPPPPAHYNPPSMFRVPRWRRDRMPAYDHAATMLFLDAFAPLGPYFESPVGFDHFAWAPLTSGTDAEP